MRTLRFFDDGRPVSYSRPLFRSRAQPKGTGTKASNRKLRDMTLLVKKALRDSSAEGWDRTKPVKVTVRFGFSPWKKDGGRGPKFGYTDVQVTELESGDFWENVPDSDNLLKMVCEALEHGGAVENDAQVVVVFVEKMIDRR